MKIELDAIWTLSPLVGFLWSMGGSGPKFMRRILVPIAVSLYAIWMSVALWLAMLQAVFLFITTTLPYGKSIKDRIGYLYFPFVYGIGASYGACLLPLAIHSHHWMRYGIICGLCSLVFGTLTFLSQKVDWPKWKWVEIITGMAIGFSACWILISS